MNNDIKTIYVHENWSSDVPKLIGVLTSQFIRGNEIFSFDYDKDWLLNNNINILDPDLLFYGGRQYLNGNKKQFGIFMDSEPDRWGRMLMKRREVLQAEKEGRSAKILTESDYLLGVDDFTRMGGLRFSFEKDGKFVSCSDNYSVPPLEKLRELEAVSLDYEKGCVENEWLNMLITPGSSLGGARPKANVIDTDGNLWIAKFPSANDSVDIGAWEFVVHELAKKCGINVPEAKCIKFSKSGSTYMTKRFDRNGKSRIHFASAMTLLGKMDGQSCECSYLDIADFIKKYGIDPGKDLKELWKRMVFSIAVKNTDDHLRNHGFILTHNAWSLSPMFDVNANPDGKVLSLNIDEADNSLSYNLALTTAKYYGIPVNEAEYIINNTKEIVALNWEKIALEQKINENSIKYMKSCFNHVTG